MGMVFYIYYWSATSTEPEGMASIYTLWVCKADANTICGGTDAAPIAYTNVEAA